METNTKTIDQLLNLATKDDFKCLIELVGADFKEINSEIKSLKERVERLESTEK